MASSNRYNEAKRGCLPYLRMSALSPSGPSAEEEVTIVEAARLLCCYKYQASSELLVQGCQISQLTSPLLGPFKRPQMMRKSKGESGKLPLSHHPHLWRLVCLECIKPGLSGFPVKTGCLPLGCLIALCLLQGSLAQYIGCSSDVFVTSKIHVNVWKPKNCGALSERIV